MVKRSVLLVQLVLLVVFVSFSSAAQDQYVGGQPQLILDLAREHGTARLTTDEYGDPMVVAEMGNLKYRILFYECGFAGCEHIQFTAGWLTQGRLSLASVNKWNQTKRFGTASIDPENDAQVDLTANLEGGVTERNLRSTFEYWISVLRDFQRFMRDEGCC